MDWDSRRCGILSQNSSVETVASEETLTRREAHRGCGVSPQAVPVASRRQESSHAIARPSPTHTR
jgi:hypothetical protein